MSTSVKVVIINILRNPDSTSVQVSRSDTSTYANFALPADCSEQDIQDGITALALSLANQNELLLTVVGKEYSGTVTDGNGSSHTSTIQVLTGASNPDSLSISYRNVSTNHQENHAADVTSTLESLEDELTGIAQSIAEAEQGSPGTIGSSASADSNI